MKTITILLALFSLSATAQITGYTPVKFRAGNQMRFVLNSESIAAISANFGEDIPELDLNGNGALEQGDLTRMLQRQGEAWFPELQCIYFGNAAPMQYQFSDFWYNSINTQGYNSCGCMPQDPLILAMTNNLCPVSLSGYINPNILHVQVTVASFGNLTFEWTYIRTQ